MINSISSDMQMPMQQTRGQNTPLTSEQKEQAIEVLEQFSADELSSDDALSIVESFSEIGIKPGAELEQIMADMGFDAKEIGGMAKDAGAQMPPPPPPQSDVSNSSEMVDFLEELLANYDEQLSDEDKTSILSAMQEKFSLANSDSLVDVTA